MGAWIETDRTNDTPHERCVAPRVGAWIETINKVQLDILRQSLPVWERGLKQLIQRIKCTSIQSLPVWERGLKHQWRAKMRQVYPSLPVWERGLKQRKQLGIE